VFEAALVAFGARTAEIMVVAELVGCGAAFYLSRIVELTGMSGSRPRG
jgi:hypothetical protein